MNRLQDKIAVVTGANSGVGAAIAKLFSKLPSQEKKAAAVQFM